MICLALDMATRFGWAAGDLRGQPTFGSVNLGEAGSKHGARFFQALIEVQRLVNEHRPKLIMIEAAIPAGPKGSAARAQLAMGYRAQVHLVAFRAGIRIDEAHIATVRSHFVGKLSKGRKNAKAKTIEQCIDLGWNVDDDNQADALALWAYTGAKLGHRRNKVAGGFL